MSVTPDAQVSPAATGARWFLLSVLVCAAVVAPLWILLAPRVVYVVAGGEATRKVPHPDEFFGADLLLGGLLCLAAVVLVAVWVVRGRQLPSATLIGLGLGGLVGGMVVALIGARLTQTDLVALASGSADGVEIVAGLRFRAYALLSWWPAVVAVAVAAVLWLNPPAEAGPTSARKRATAAPAGRADSEAAAAVTLDD